MRRFCSLVLLSLFGCGPTVFEEDPAEPGTETNTDPPAATTAGTPPPPSTTTTTTTTGPTGGDPPPGSTGETGLDPDGSQGDGDFIMEPDGGGKVCSCCDVFAQDCPQGEKCSAWANDAGDHWNGTRCSAIPRNPGQPGDPCTVDGGPASGVDDCDFGAMCWGVDPQTLEGTCVGLCMNSEDLPLCEDPNTGCIITNDGVLNLCLPSCDPLANDCGPDQACAPGDQGFVCMSTIAGSTATEAEACTYAYDCEPGLLCRASLGVGPICDQGSPQCCTAYCDLLAAEPAALCPDPAHACVSWWGQRQPPAGLEHVGICQLP